MPLQQNLSQLFKAAWWLEPCLMQMHGTKWTGLQSFAQSKRFNAGAIPDAFLCGCSARELPCFLQMTTLVRIKASMRRFLIYLCAAARSQAVSETQWMREYLSRCMAR